MTKTDKAFLKYYDENNFGNRPANEVKIAKLAFTAGFKAAQERPICKICNDEIDFCRNCYINEIAGDEATT